VSAASAQLALMPAPIMRLAGKLKFGKNRATLSAEPAAAPSVFAPYRTGIHRAGSCASVVTTFEASGSDTPIQNVGQSVTMKISAASAAGDQFIAPRRTYSQS
jgi:hypothetical protein